MRLRPPCFTLEWLMPQELARDIAVLYDAEQHSEHVRWARGTDEAGALLDLWATLREDDASQDAIARVAEAPVFRRRESRRALG
jgi:hypothetical protein